MSEEAKAVLEKALKLSARERAALAEDLLESLDDDIDPEIETAWMAEAGRRLAKADRDPSLLIDGEKVFADIRSEFGIK